MVDVAALRAYRERRSFAEWDGYVASEHVAASERSIRRLLGDLIALDPPATEQDARRAVDECVRRFNTLDDGWVCTIEREAIGDCIHDVVGLCGFAWSEDWLDEADW